MSGTVHPYYAVALAPAIGRAGGDGVSDRLAATGLAGGAADVGRDGAGNGAWDYVLLARTADFVPWAKYVVLAAGVIGAALVVGGRRMRRLLPAVVLALVVSLGLGSTAYAVSTASQRTTARSRRRVRAPARWAAACARRRRSGPGGSRSSTPPSRLNRFNHDRGPGREGNDASASSELTALLAKTTTTWAAATSGSQSAASLELATGKSVIAIGGFSGTDDAPTLAQFKEWVAEGKIAYYISGGKAAAPASSSSAASEIQSWVEATLHRDNRRQHRPSTDSSPDVQPFTASRHPAGVAAGTGISVRHRAGPAAWQTLVS